MDPQRLAGVLPTLDCKLSYTYCFPWSTDLRLDLEQVFADFNFTPEEGIARFLYNGLFFFTVLVYVI